MTQLGSPRRTRPVGRQDRAPGKCGVLPLCGAHEGERLLRVVERRSDEDVAAGHPSRAVADVGHVVGHFGPIEAMESAHELGDIFSQEEVGWCAAARARKTVCPLGDHGCAGHVPGLEVDVVLGNARSRFPHEGHEVVSSTRGSNCAVVDRGDARLVVSRVNDPAAGPRLSVFDQHADDRGELAPVGRVKVLARAPCDRVPFAAVSVHNRVSPRLGGRIGNGGDRRPREVLRHRGACARTYRRRPEGQVEPEGVVEDDGGLLVGW